MTAPESWKFALSPDQREFAVWMPGNEPWFAQTLGNDKGRWIGSADLERAGWTVFDKPDPLRHEPEPDLCQAEITDPDTDEIHVCARPSHTIDRHECSCTFLWGRGGVSSG